MRILAFESRAGSGRDFQVQGDRFGTGGFSLAEAQEFYPSDRGTG